MTPSSRLLAYPGGQASKDAILVQIAGHRKAGEIIKGVYWGNGKGCLIGCILHSGDHAKIESQFGIPQMLGRLASRIFEGLPDALALMFPERFMSAFVPGLDYSLCGWQFLHWIMDDIEFNPGNDHKLVRAAVKKAADVISTLAQGGSVSKGMALSAEFAATKAERDAAAAVDKDAATAAGVGGGAVFASVCAAQIAVLAAKAAGTTSAQSAAVFAGKISAVPPRASWHAEWLAVFAAKVAAKTPPSSAARAAASAAWCEEGEAHVMMGEKLLTIIGRT